MGEYYIKGGNRLMGELRVSGAKNAVLPILAAAVLNKSESVIHNCPNIQDTRLSVEILKHIGCTVKVEGNTIIINSAAADSWDVPDDLAQEMRSSIIFMGGLLGRFGHADISQPGGCLLGSRPIDLHIKSLRAMGVTIEEPHGKLHCKADCLKGTRIHLGITSVGATENIMLAAVRAEGQTVIAHAAREPEIVDLQHYLNGMGADVQGAGTDTIVINGVKELHAVEHCVMPDRIVAGTYLAAAAITGGNVTLTRVEPLDMQSVTARLMDMGCRIKETKGTLSLEAPKRLKALDRLFTGSHPAFPTDMQAQFVSALTLAEGTSVVNETIFDSRNKHAAELSRMGADILVLQDGKSFVINGKNKLEGAEVSAMDLRGGAALIIAGLAAEGETIVKNAHYVERGYEEIEKSLISVGGDIVLR